MAYKTISNLRDSVSGMLQGLNLNNVTNLNTALERTARQVCVKLDIPEATLRQNLTTYDGVIDYLAPTDMFASAIVDLRPQGMDRDYNATVQKQPIETFDREKGWVNVGYKTAVEYDKGTGILRISSAAPVAKLEIDPMTAVTGWTAGGSASGILADSTVFWQSPSSIRFLLTGASSGTLTKTTPSLDLTNYQGVGVGFLAFRTPSASNLTSIELRIGSDASNYYSVTVTAGFIKAFTANDWMLASFDLSTATTVGTPVVTTIDYTQIIVTHGATLTNFYVGGLWISLPSPQTLIYQTSAIFLAAGATQPSATIVNTADQVLLNDSAYAIYEVECALEIAAQQGGTLANGVIQNLSRKLNGVKAAGGIVTELGLIDSYRADNPSQEIRMTGSYYDM
jgi:hypothetical protein